MEYVKFGSTGREVSRLGFGGAVLGLKNYLDDFDPKNPAQRADCIKAIHRSLELGVTYFDTAQVYGDGESETVLGEALKGHDTGRLFIASKIPPHFEKGSAISLVEGSLRRLGVSTLDLLQFHGSSYSRELTEQIMEPEGRLDELLELKRQGMIRHIGFTTEDNNAAVYDFIEDGRFEMYQTCYNLVMQHPYDPNREFGSMYDAKKAGMGISVMRSVTFGIFQRWMQMIQPDNKHDYTPDLLQFVFSNPLIDVVLVGMRNVREVEQNVMICDDVEKRIDILKMFTYYANPMDNPSRKR